VIGGTAAQTPTSRLQRVREYIEEKRCPQRFVGRRFIWIVSAPVFSGKDLCIAPCIAEQFVVRDIHLAGGLKGGYHLIITVDSSKVEDGK